MTSTTRRWTNRIALGVAVATLIAAPSVALASDNTTSTVVAAHSSPPAAKPTVVLVHGAWADASSFAPVTKLLQDDGYTVLAAPNPLRGLASDAASVAAFVNQATTGPVVLVGHSYGGAVITNAALSTPSVTDLVFVDAYAPDKGETVSQLTGEKPGSMLAAEPSTVFDVVQDPTMPTGNPDLYVKRDLFRSAFAAHLGAGNAAALAASQSPVTGGALQEPSGDAAWKSISSWFVIGTADKVIPPAQQRSMASRAQGHVTSVFADHLAMLEQPGAVANVIDNAATSK
ncbi:alpha/beta hydrolase [Promicromonospora sp. NPDC050262]|uniref:alpha/beta fold hydrolase n=1 Tax=Promicromonospora sp. NPDC050262 TaxID=3155036 RepID=UPI0033FA8043